VQYPIPSNLLEEELRKMKSKSLSVVAMVLLTHGLAFAGPKNSADLQLNQTVKVAGTQLAPGKYKVNWQGSGPDITVSFTDGKKTVATVPAKLVNDSNSEEAIETDMVPNTTTVLRAIDLKHFTIQFGNGASAAGN
jgi:hypothetical protein